MVEISFFSLFFLDAGCHKILVCTLENWYNKFTGMGVSISKFYVVAMLPHGSVTINKISVYLTLWQCGRVAVWLQTQKKHPAMVA